MSSAAARYDETKEAMANVLRAKLGHVVARAGGMNTDELLEAIAPMLWLETELRDRIRTALGRSVPREALANLGLLAVNITMAPGARPIMIYHADEALALIRNLPELRLRVDAALAAGRLGGWE